MMPHKKTAIYNRTLGICLFVWQTKRGYIWEVFSSSFLLSKFHTCPGTAVPDIRSVMLNRRWSHRKGSAVSSDPAPEWSIGSSSFSETPLKAHRSINTHQHTHTHTSKD